jgi:hypothetical protein
MHYWMDMSIASKGYYLFIYQSESLEELRFFFFGLAFFFTSSSPD